MIPQVTLPQELLDAPFTLGPLAENIHNSRRTTIGFTRKVREKGKLVSAKTYLSCYIASFYNDGGENRCVIHIDDPARPRDMDMIQVIPYSIINQYTLEAADAARRLELSVEEENKKRAIKRSMTKQP